MLVIYDVILFNMKTLFFTFIIFLLPISASACSYIYETPAESYNNNPIVFIGEITNLESTGGLNGSRQVAFDILKKYKGIDQDEITLETGANSALCGFDDGALAEGQIWVIHTANLDNFISLPVNISFDSLEEAEAYMNPIVEDPILCTLEYAPVCGRVDTGIRCITTPCDTYIEKTYSNNCMLEAADAEFLYQGECRINNNEPPIVKEDSEDPEGIDDGDDREYTPNSNEDDVKNETSENFWTKVVNFFKRIFGF